jgi:hypothetical protein
VGGAVRAEMKAGSGLSEQAASGQGGEIGGVPPPPCSASEGGDGHHLSLRCRDS